MCGYLPSDAPLTALQDMRDTYGGLCKILSGLEDYSTVS